MSFRFLTAVLGTDAVAHSPLEIGFRVGFDEGVNRSDVSFVVAAAVTRRRVTAHTRYGSCILNQFKRVNETRS